MINFKNNKGITLTTLIITVIVLATIAGTAVYTGMDVYQDAKKEALVAELQIIQNAVNNEYSKIEAEDFRYVNYGEDLTNTVEGLGDKSYRGYKKFTPEKLEEELGVKGVNQTVYINFLRKHVISEKGIKEGEEIIYSLEDNMISPNEDDLKKLYIEDGLKVFLDGHTSPQINSDDNWIWEDESGNNNDVKITFNTGSIEDNIEINGIKIGKQVLTYKFLEKEISLVNGHTFDFVFEIRNLGGTYASSLYQYLFHSYPYLRYRGFSPGNNRVDDYSYGIGGHSSGKGAEIWGVSQSIGEGSYTFNYTMSETDTNYKKQFYMNGKKEAEGEGTIPENMRKGTENYIPYRTIVTEGKSGGMNYLETYFSSVNAEFDMLLHGIRIYDRVLDSNEIKHNNYLDAVRFNLK